MDGILDNSTPFEILDLDYPSLEIVEPPVQIGLVVLFSLTATISLVGNLTVILVLTCGKRYVIGILDTRKKKKLSSTWFELHY
jgi:hypothetical protein